MCCCVVFISLVRRCIARPDADGVFYRDDKDAPVSDFSRLGGFQDGLNGLFHVLLAHHDREQDALYRTGIVHYAPVNAPFAGLSHAPHIVIRKPFDVGF